MHAWSSPMDTLAPYAPLRSQPSRDQQREASSVLLTAAISHALGTASAASEVNVRPMLIAGRPIVVLLQYAVGAHMLVLGRALRASYAGDITLGVIGRTCTAYAQCPVVIVSATEPPDDKNPSLHSAGNGIHSACDDDLTEELPKKEVAGHGVYGCEGQDPGS